ncbi:FeoA domain-containing protein [Myxococcota bacterium]|nr:FeoA domain-containing protein [Myxococcota bacterium]
MTGMMGFHNMREEILESIWTLSEDGEATCKGVLEEIANGETQTEIDQLLKDGLISRENGKLSLTDKGKPIARHVVRAHRLAARLLSDLFEMDKELIEGLACQLEHAITPELADNFCTLLGHPPSGPNGCPIPPGDCCKKARSDVVAVIRKLPDMKLGHEGKITFIHPRFVERLDQLTSLGLVPGTIIRLKQHHPSVVIEVGETTLALDVEVANDIYVKPLGKA